MKKYIVLTLLVLLSLGANAQKRGDHYVGTSVAATYVDGNPTTWSAGASVEFGYFVFKNWKVTASAGYSYQHESYVEAGNPFAGTHVLLLGPSISYYVKLANGLYYTPEAGVYYAFGGTWQHSTEYDFHARLDGFQIGISLFSLEYKPTDKFGVTLSVCELGGGQMVGSSTNGSYRVLIQNKDLLFNSKSSMGVRFYF